MDCALEVGAFLPALVTMTASEAGIEGTVRRESDGRQVAMLKIASRDGGFAAPALTVGPNGPDLAPGDFVAWQAAELSSEVAVASSDSRFGWVGLILGRLKPEWTTKGWVVADRFG